MPITGTPENGTIVLELPDAGIVLDTFNSYSFNSHFLTPTDGWHFNVGDETISDKLLQALTPGQSVQLKVDDLIQASGFVDRVDIRSDRSGGTEVSIAGRDVLAPAVDANIDPRMRFSEGQTLEQILFAIFQQFGFNAMVVDDEANLNVMRGQTRGIKTSKKGKPLKSFITHQLKPYPHEGAFAFASRLTQRHGLWIWPSADGKALIVGKPIFDQEASYALRHKRGAAGVDNNVVSSSVCRDGTDQPSIIVATGYGAGGAFPRSSLKAIAINELTAYGPDGDFVPVVKQVLKDNPEAVRIDVRTDFGHEALVPSKVARPLYLHDDESKTPEQLANYVRRELALRQRKAFTGHYIVEGHKNSGAPWTVNSIVDIDDDVSNVHGAFWILSRTFNKDRTGTGTRTELEIIRPNTLAF